MARSLPHQRHASESWHLVETECSTTGDPSFSWDDAWGLVGAQGMRGAGCAPDERPARPPYASRCVGAISAVSSFEIGQFALASAASAASLSVCRARTLAFDPLLFSRQKDGVAEEEIISKSESEVADVAAVPGDAGDPAEMVARYVPADVLARYEVYSYRNAALILSQAHPAEFGELMDALRGFRITTQIIAKAGGNESEIPKLVSGLLRPLGWQETTIQADLLVKLFWREAQTNARGRTQRVQMTREIAKAKFLDGHKVDYVKGRVAFDLEWNSKDQTFDRDLYAMSAFSQCGVIDVGVLLTRSEALNPLFRSLGLMAKYGASTTWMGKLLYRLNAGRNGSCPVLAIGIRPECVED